MSWKIHNRGGGFRVVVTRALPGDRWLSVLVAAGAEVHVWTSPHVLTTAEIERAIGDRCDGVVGQLTEDWGESLFDALRRAGGLVYSNYAAGHDNVQVEVATRCGVAVGNTPGVLTETTAEMAVALLFAAARRIPEADRFIREGEFHGWLPDLFLGKRLWGGVLGLVGAGRIGAALARMVAPSHDMDLLYHDVERREALEDHFGAVNRLRAGTGDRPLACERVLDLGDLLSRADVVSLHVPLMAATRHLIDGRRLALMKPDAILVNTSRGPVIDEAALVAHLKSHPEFRAGLDVFENEPALAPGLAKLPNAVLAPHIASATRWTREGMATLAACNVAALLRGDPVARELRVEEYLEGEQPARKAPSIVNAAELGLAAS